MEEKGNKIKSKKKRKSSSKSKKLASNSPTLKKSKRESGISKSYLKQADTEKRRTSLLL